jgi:hypothetical protein
MNKHLILLLVLFTGCVSTPPEVAILHEKQGELMAELKRAHLAMVDAYVAEKLQSFEQFYFQEYGPVYRRNWEAAFKEQLGREYDREKDFPRLYNDLVAEYNATIQPIAQLRTDLHVRISGAHDQALAAHDTVGGWIRSVEKLSSAERDAANRLLKAIHPALSLDQVDQAIERLRTEVQSRLE